jgi:post-segregation antitoxin (ccd killing protein)
MEFLLNWHPALSITVICLFSLGISYLGLRLVKRRFESDTLAENHEVGGFIFNAFGLIYAVLIAFVVYATWSEYDDARINIDSEASELADLYHSARTISPEMQKAVSAAIAEYINNVSEDEWQLMSSGKSSTKASASFRKLWDIYTGVDVSRLSNEPVYRESLKHLNSLGERRRARIFDSANDVPGIIWGVLLFGGVMTVFYTFFFSTRKFLPQFCMTSGLAVLITIILYMIYVLDKPFVGYNKVGYGAFAFVIDLVGK